MFNYIYFLKIYILITTIGYLYITRIPFIFFSKNKEDEYKFYRENYIQFSKTVYIPFLNIFMRKKSNIINSKSDYKSDQKWYYINGICTSINYAKFTINNMEKKFKKPITLVYNESKSFVIDMIESTIQTFVPIYTKTLKKFAKEIVTNIKNEKITIILAYSEGSIITSNLLHYLLKKYSTINFTYIKIFCFGNIGLFNHNFKKNNKPHIELFYNNYDFGFNFFNYIMRQKNAYKILSNNYGSHWINYDYIRPLCKHNQYNRSTLLKYF